VALCISFSSINKVFPKALKIAVTSFNFNCPFLFAHKQVMDSDTAIAVFGILLTIAILFPIACSISIIFLPVITETIVCVLEFK
jgi:hypothetical protein